MNMPIEMIIDIALVGLLAVVIASSFILNRRIETLRKGQAEMANLVEKLDKATTTAQLSVGQLRQTGSKAQDELSREISRGRALADELALITEAGDNLASRLEQRLSAAADRQKKQSGPTLRDMDVASENRMANEDGQHSIIEALKHAR
jgi:predicted  nucleic acid-binding Zn-ribbon protein